MNSTITRNLRIGFGLSLLLLISTSIASYISIHRLVQSSSDVNHTNQVIQQLENVISTLKDAETGQRGYLLTNDTEFLQPYTGAYEQALKYLENVEHLVEDNPTQLATQVELKRIVVQRLSRLRELIDHKESRLTVTVADLKAGKLYMDQARAQVNKMQNLEKNLLAKRNANLGRFSTITPIIIVLAALFAVFITIYFYFKLMNDFRERVKLQQRLLDKDAEITSRITIIRNIAEKISSGDYAIRVKDEEKDGLGNLSYSLNKMAESLQYSFQLLSDKEWMQTGVALLNEKMVGEKDTLTLANNVVETICQYLKASVGALYLVSNDRSLELSGSYAFKHDSTRARIRAGEGLLGECAQSGKDILLEEVPAEHIVISFASGDLRPRQVFVFPIFHSGKIKGVIELAALQPFSERDMEFLRSVSPNIGISIHAAQNRRKLQDLLEETQSQSEELQAQHSELENLNAEMEAQTQKLQASDEELRVQQEELLQANQELEERSRLLEEKNQVIVERNLEIQRKAEDLEQSTRYKSEFLANMSHELRTPLNSILLLSRMMTENTDKNLTTEQVESASVIQNSGKSLLSLIDEILDLSKIEAGKMELEYLDVRFDEIAGDMRSLFSPIAREKNLELVISMDKALPVTLSTDKLRLEQILKNLLSNALKFTAKGSVRLDIWPVDEHFVAFSVKDTGVGIPEDKRGLIFEAFQQADGSTRRKFGGTGLGLSISRELARLLGGEIQLKSELGKGSDFTVHVPIIQPSTDAPVSDAEQPVEFNPVEQSAKRFVTSAIPSSIPDDRKELQPGEKVILIVEDDTTFAKVLLDFTRKQGYKGIVAVRGDEALEMAHLYHPLAILLDIQLPIKDGWEVMDELKSNPKTRQIPVHIMSSMEVKKESLVKGAIDFINKPVALEQMHLIFKKLEEALNKGPRKVLIIEENAKHAKALAYFLETYNISVDIKGNIDEGVSSLQKREIDCVILDMGIPDQNAYETLETVKKNPGLENLPIILFTGKNLSKAEENKIRQYADSIVVKTAHSYQRIMDEVALFLHVVEESSSDTPNVRKLSTSLVNILKNKKVLIADDDVRNIYSLTKALENHKMKVISATDGKEALRQLDENPDVDIVLMDMMMPELDGYESTSQIRKNPRHKHLPILAVTAKAMVGDREKCIRAGASDYISKPVDIDQLVSLLRVWLYDKTS